MSGKHNCRVVFIKFIVVVETTPACRQLETGKILTGNFQHLISRLVCLTGNHGAIIYILINLHSAKHM